MSTITFAENASREGILAEKLKILIVTVLVYGVVRLLVE
jgi:hypothetical protein